MTGSRGRKLQVRLCVIVLCNLCVDFAWSRWSTSPGDAIWCLAVLDHGSGGPGYLCRLLVPLFVVVCDATVALAMVRGK